MEANDTWLLLFRDFNHATDAQKGTFLNRLLKFRGSNVKESTELIGIQDTFPLHAFDLIYCLNRNW